MSFAMQCVHPCVAHHRKHVHTSTPFVQKCKYS
uniref:Uncharacterized protein n=1 Tax=Arundo donax TaxID=35708 RepID=A0A0A9AB09_ARUDO